MKTFLNRYGLTIGAAAALLVGCGSQATLALPETMGQTRAISSDRSRQRLFVTEYSQNTLLVYDATETYRNPEKRITIGLGEPSGDCIDGNGTLYVANTEGWIPNIRPAERARIGSLKKGWVVRSSARLMVAATSG